MVMPLVGRSEEEKVIPGPHAIRYAGSKDFVAGKIGLVRKNWFC
jgi:hypothetical protein